MKLSRVLKDLKLSFANADIGLVSVLAGVGVVALVFSVLRQASPLVYSQPVKPASPSRGSSSQFSDLAEAWIRLSPLVFTRARPQISESHRFTARSRLALNASNQNLSFFQSVTVQMDFAPFKQWYLQHYGIDIGRKKKPVVAKKETNEVLHYGIDCLAELMKKTNGQCFPEDVNGFLRMSLPIALDNFG
nr:40S ribosomal protein S8-like isoform X2 [Ipomoea trifida]